MAETNNDPEEEMNKIISLFLILALTSTTWANTSKYVIIFVDKSKTPCSILENDPPSKRLKIQAENSVKTDWVSYYSIGAIIEAMSQKDVTSEFIQPSVKKIESRAMVGVDSSVYTYLVISAVIAIVFYIVAVNNIKD